MHAYTVTGRPSAGGVLAVLTGARADADVAACAGQLAARTGRKITAAVAFRSTGFSINALLHLARNCRLTHQADAVLALHADALIAAGHYRSTIAVLPARTNPYHRLPTRTSKRLAHRTGSATVITSVLLHPPGQRFTPDTAATAARTADPPAPSSLVEQRERGAHQARHVTRRQAGPGAPFASPVEPAAGRKRATGRQLPRSPGALTRLRRRRH
ncbi:hypothetical protein AQJ66_29540 [Streptomyces bungoensis]|uniref:Uncharacterized protein n=1 Tax=Streptomyces bungoensis TaxID=285568 RepID=A0A101SS12_9ACTN|nr:hypothetical protein [Streptomyces bungoensis]KUN79023.1 hypothetical protein AQJ66_29540 [Streptomyces bungoensis]